MPLSLLQRSCQDMPYKLWVPSFTACAVQLPRFGELIWGRTCCLKSSFYSSDSPGLGWSLNLFYEVKKTHSLDASLWADPVEASGTWKLLQFKWKHEHPRRPAAFFFLSEAEILQQHIWLHQRPSVMCSSFSSTFYPFRNVTPALHASF